MRLREHCRIAIGRQRRPDDPQLRKLLGSSRSLDVHRAINHALAQSTARMRSRPRWWDQHAPRGAKATQHASRCRRPPCASGLELSQLEGSLIRTRMRSSISDLHACTLRAVRAKKWTSTGMEANLCHLWAHGVSRGCACDTCRAAALGDNGGWHKSGALSQSNQSRTIVLAGHLEGLASWLT